MSTTLSHLQPGHVVEFEGERWLVTMVNDCRARLVPQQKKVVVVVTASGKSVTFQRYGASINVSPNSELPVVGIDRAFLSSLKVC